MLDTKVLILAIISTLFVIGWSVLGIADAFRSDKPQVSADPKPSTEPQGELARRP